MEIFEKINQIYMCLMDDDSKYIFEKRLLYSLTGNSSYIDEIICKKFYLHMKEQFKRMSFDDNSIVAQMCKILRDKRIIIYGAGGYGLLYLALLESCIIRADVIGYYDKYKKGDFFGLERIDIQDFDEDVNWLITQKDILLKNEIEGELKDLGIKESKILRFDSVDLMDFTGIYFPNFLSFKNEVFVDGGCYDGKSSMDLIKICKDYKKIYAFEPDKENIKLINKKFASENIEILPYGLWDEKMELHFSSGGQGSRIDESGEETISVDSIDNCVDDCVTYIKMDIEGSELKALLGAKEIIQKYQPKLAISIYHKKEDIIDIPLTILKLNSRYKFFLRHYSPGTYDTVLYATVE